VLSPPRKRGSRSVDIEVYSGFRGNDRHGMIFDGVSQLSKAA